MFAVYCNNILFISELMINGDQHGADNDGVDAEDDDDNDDGENT